MVPNKTLKATKACTCQVGSWLVISTKMYADLRTYTIHDTFTVLRMDRIKDADLADDGAEDQKQNRSAHK